MRATGGTGRESIGARIAHIGNGGHGTNRVLEAARRRLMGEDVAEKEV